MAITHHIRFFDSITVQPTPRQTPPPSAPRTTPRSPYPILPAAHESAPHPARHGRTAAGGRAGGANTESIPFP